MKLIRYRVTTFRSVDDSGWIELDRVIALIGVNESGKTNLLVPLWKLNPAREGEIQPTSDYPKKRFGEIREAPGKFTFVTADFEIEELAQQVAQITGQAADLLKVARVSRSYDGSYKVDFPGCIINRSVRGDEILALANSTKTSISSAIKLAKEDGLADELIAAIDGAVKFDVGLTLSAGNLRYILAELRKKLPAEPAKTSVIVPTYSQFIDQIETKEKLLARPSPGDVEGVEKVIVEALPKFVYYSNYGNLDSEIYLPHVVENLKRKELGAKEAAKARTLRVLFKFVRLSPDEILELGRDFKDQTRQPTSEEISAIAEKKRERSILLQSAGTTLTGKFKDWWKQGDYRFRFEADGDHFRIWVSDDRRPEEVELESRSTGLQWFLSFYLVFLVESAGEHQNSILLLDEPGLSLHPLAQKNLSTFFEGLSETNQILYTTHSPFLVDADRLDRARKVYVDADGTSKATEDLRQGADVGAQVGAAYAVHSALNLNVAESLLLGCAPVIVEGPSDQHYLTAIKVLLIGNAKITPKRELVFPPSGGTKTARITASILSGRDDTPPLVLLDGDQMGSRMAKELQLGLYVDAKERVLTVDSFSGLAGSEIEDIYPAEFLARAVDRVLRGPEELFSDVLELGKPIVPQIEAWATKHSISLYQGWKVDLAKRVKQLALDKGISQFDAETIGKWVRLFEAFEN